MRVWIDLANAPHVGFFLPIMQRLQSAGHVLKATCRDFNHTPAIAREHGIAADVVGRHGGRSDALKMVNLAVRSLQLASAMRQWKPDVCASHNSYTHTVAGRLLGCRVVTLMDYEGQPANHIAFRLAHRVIVPDCFPEAALRRFGALGRDVVRYSGFKEQLYLSDYVPREGFAVSLRTACALPESWDLESKVLVTVRTPATMAAYHHFTNELFGKLLAELNERRDLTTVVLPRDDEQEERIRRHFRNLVIPSRPLIGADLVYHSDVVISAGGTMNREAAILGTRVYTIFAGELPAVDRRLVELGRLTSIRSERDIAAIRFEKIGARNVLRNPGLCDEIVTHLIAWGNSTRVGVPASSATPARREEPPRLAAPFRVYYAVKGLIPRRTQIALRSVVAKRKRVIHRACWPVDETAEGVPENFTGWPDGRRFALVLRHDVEGPSGLARTLDVARLEGYRGFRAAYYLVPRAYDVTPEFLAALRRGGNEVGVHGWTHDGRLYSSRAIFEWRAARINEVLRRWQAVGFASPSAHHHFEWIHGLRIDYDTSSFDTDPFEPQPDGIGTIFPLMIRRGAGGYVELPYTLPQDFTLFVVLKEGDNRIWKQKLDWIAEKGGMALLNTHPDYLRLESEPHGVCGYSAELYWDFLEYVRSRYEGQYWHALPQEVAAFWRSRVAGSGPQLGIRPS